MSLSTPLSERIGIEHPFMQAGMGGIGPITLARLAAAISEAGALGTLAQPALVLEEGGGEQEGVEEQVQAVVAQVPTISGFETGLRRIPPEHIAELERRFDEDERAQLAGAAPRMQAVVSDDPAAAASYRTRESIDFYLQPLDRPVWTNEVTFRSSRWARMYEPGAWITRVSPTPLLMLVA